MADGYYLAANGSVAAKPYTLLRQALERSSKVAIAKFAWHGRERLGVLRVVDDVIVLHSMKWPDEVRRPEDAGRAPEAEVSDVEIDAAVERKLHRLRMDRILVRPRQGNQGDRRCNTRRRRLDAYGHRSPGRAHGSEGTGSGRCGPRQA
ncbi:hypothetical protein G3I19_04540 [Streptomyces sp. SID10853]|nr:hypothetical protein [Streptomyces sp. SID10853]